MTNTTPQEALDVEGLKEQTLDDLFLRSYDTAEDVVKMTIDNLASHGYLRSKQEPSVTKAIKWLEEWFYGTDRSSELEAEDFEDFDRVIAAARSAELTGEK